MGSVVGLAAELAMAAASAASPAVGIAGLEFGQHRAATLDATQECRQRGRADWKGGRKGRNAHRDSITMRRIIARPGAHETA